MADIISHTPEGDPRRETGPSSTGSASPGMLGETEQGTADTGHGAGGFVDEPLDAPRLKGDAAVAEILDENPEVDALMREESDREVFPCDNCGARMRWHPDEDAMHCQYCGHVRAVDRGEGTILERPLSEAGTAARGLGVDLRVLQCDTCGARVAHEEVTTAKSCVYCGSSSVLSQEANRNAIRPESLIPLDIGKGGVETAFAKWIGGLWFRPNDLKDTKRFDSVGVYVPYWTFDASVHSDWTADAGYYYYVNQTYITRVNGRMVTRTRRVRKVRWVPAWGERDDVYDDLLVPASKGLDADLLQKLGSFDTSGLVPYRPHYLAGWRAEEYQVDLEQGWVGGQARIEQQQRSRCSGDVPGDTQRSLAVRNQISDVHWKHVLLPIWSLAYRYREKTYTVLVHGQTGRVVGKAPYSWWKIALTVIVVGGAVAAGVVAGG